MKLPKSYEPNLYEPEIYGLWENSSAFEPSETGEPYSIVMPPLNANGNLHVGHALTLAIQDILIRYHRMKGYSTEYIPGADHAGFETWVVYDKILQEKGRVGLILPESSCIARFGISYKSNEAIWSFSNAH